MPRVMVRAEDRPDQTLLDETVEVCHIEDAHYSLQFLERLAWAIHDGAEAESRRHKRRNRIANTPKPQPVRAPRQSYNGAKPRQRAGARG